MSQQVKIPKKRNGYYYIENLELPSITKVIGEVIAKPALIYWIKREAIRLALKHPELNEKEVITLLDLQLRQTQERGHYVHSIAEIMPNIDISKTKKEYLGYITGLKGWWDKEKPNILYREIEAFNTKIGYGCRVDFVCDIRGETWNIDFKSSAKGIIYKEVGLQNIAGKLALKETYNIEVKHMGVVALSETGEDTFKETNDTEEDLIHLIGMYNWIKRKGD